MPPLPFDIIHTLVDFAFVGDLINFCSTCKALHHHLANDSLWKRLCASYGLRDFTHFGGLSPFAIYTKLVYRYGPILGLWANDHPFRGNVMEFRLFAGDEVEQGGIIGEIVSFGMHVDRDPTPPSYIRATKISFEPEHSEEEARLLNDTAEPDAHAEARVFCCDDPSMFTATRHSATLHVCAETTTRHHLQFYLKTVILPDFPQPSTAWYDESPRLPHLPAQPDFQQDQSSIVKIYPAVRLPMIWTGPSDIPKPPAISIRCLRSQEECPCAALHVPSVPFESLDQRLPRYYPVKRAMLPGVEPRSPDWSLQTMEGLWYGAYGFSGTELLHLTYESNDSGSVLVATKITGDVHIPRGWISWALQVLEEGSDDAQAFRDHWTQSLPADAARGDSASSSPARIMCGGGSLAAQGFVNVTSCAITGGVINADELQIYWPHSFRTYRRYTGRDVGPMHS
ncbi:hypothetical protein K466DRAFT_601092 [Polyporus arcularius HHB13444]|uniref:F-box domain-containing protein n=1 Tax=Polyporus arcularius HHB13444 TaxID=1314778 RepID=A0A5C3P791_9APHY|nr:hypothetical protein K466DRAFT_601092 [Polyporus arcularius HHB13444]